MREIYLLLILVTTFISSSLTNYSFLCTFENGLCGFHQDQGDDYDWIRSKGDTPSYMTGPTSDHTLHNASGYYMYLEASAPHKPGDIASLESPVIPSSPTSPMCLNFWYSMYGYTMGILNVYVKTNTTIGSTILSMKNDHGDSWTEASVNISATFSNFTLVFEGVKGYGFLSDMALDDVSISTGHCSFAAHTSTVQPSPPASTSKATVSTGRGSVHSSPTAAHRNYSLTCTFEKDLCGFVQDQADDYDWIRSRGDTPDFSRSPPTDHTLHNGVGYYLYVEVASPHEPGDKARLESPVIPPSPTFPMCLTFWYTMYGSTTGTFNVYARNNTNHLGQPVWTLTNSNSYTWKEAIVQLAASSSEVTVVFEGVCGIDLFKVIAIDDIKISTGACPHAV